MTRFPERVAAVGRAARARWSALGPAGRRAAVAGAASIGLLALLAVWRGGGREAPTSPLAVVARGPLVISLTEAGTVQSRDTVTVRSEVEGRNTILWLADEGKTVKEGDLLVELDASKLEQSRVEQQIRALNAQALLVQSRESLAVVQNQAQASVEAAELRVRFAQLDLEKYRSGQFPQDLRQAEADITIAREELQRSDETYEWSLRLQTNGYITRTELQADQLAVMRRRLDLELAEGRLALLTNFTREQTAEKLNSEIRQAELALERERRKSTSDVVRAEADLRAKESEATQQEDKLKQLVDQIGKCKIRAPAGGMVVYATTARSHRWGNDEPLETGQEVVQRQELIQIPGQSGMKAEFRIPEASLAKIRTGLPARITVDALPGRAFGGRLQKIAVLPDSGQSWLNPDLKLYDCEVEFDDGSSDLRPGMSCRVEVVIEEHADALHVPVACVVRIDGNPVVYVMESGGARPRPVEVGLDNNRVVHIRSGLAAGERVLLAPPLPASTRREAVAPRPPPSPAAATNAAPAGSGPRPSVRRGEGGGRPARPAGAPPGGGG